MRDISSDSGNHTKGPQGADHTFWKSGPNIHTSTCRNVLNICYVGRMRCNEAPVRGTYALIPAERSPEMTHLSNYPFVLV